MNTLAKRNTRIYYGTQLFVNAAFTIPIWIAYYQGFLNPVEISTIVGFQYLIQIVMELPSGAFADLLGRKVSLLIAFAFGAAGLLLFPFANEFWHFLLLATFTGLSDSFRSGSEEAIMYDSYKESGNESGFEKVSANGNLVTQAGLIVGSLTGGILFQLNVFLPYIAYGIAYLICFFIAAFYEEPNIDSEKFTIKNYILQIRNGIKEAFKDKLTTYTSLFYIFVGGITWTHALYFGSYFILSLGFGDVERGLIQGSARLINALAISYVLRKLKLNDTLRILFFPIAMLIAFLPGYFLGGWGGIPFLEIAMLAASCRWIFLTPITNRAFSSKVRATAISVLSLIIGIIYIAIVTISGPIISNLGVGAMYTVLGILTLVTVLPAGILLLRTKKNLAV